MLHRIRDTLGRGDAVVELFAAKQTRFQENLEVSRGGAGPLRVVAEKADGGVAWRAEQASHLAGLVAVIDAKQLVGRFPADRAAAALTGQELLVILPLEAVFGFEMTSHFARVHAFAIFGIVLAPAPIRRVDPVPDRCPVLRLAVAIIT